MLTRSGFLWTLALDAALCGVLMAGYSARCAFARGLATAFASTVGSAIAAIQLLFLLGALGRISAAVLGLRIVESDATA